MQQLRPDVLQYLEGHHDRYLAALRELAQIPAPSGQEERRAQWCKAYLESLGAKGVYIDPALNVIFPYQVQPGSRNLTVVAAHTDVVFPDLDPLPLREEEGRLYAPGIGDDTANVIAVIEMAAMAVDLGLNAPDGILFVLNSGEEGLGNLKGTRQLMRDFQGRIGRLLAIDGGYRHLVNDAVGSKRYQITIRTEGGHSYGSFGNRNAIHYMAQMIDTLYTIKAPEFGHTTYNVGTIQGGTSVNTIAQECTMLYEYRSDRREGLAAMDRFFEPVVQTYRAMGVAVEVRQVGDRPCKGEVDNAPLTQLVLEAAACHGVAMETGSGSTDCNIPLSQGIPAVCFGVYHGDGAHTREEWLELASIPVGRRILAQVLMEYLRG